MARLPELSFEPQTREYVVFVPYGDVRSLMTAHLVTLSADKAAASWLALEQARVIGSMVIVATIGFFRRSERVSRAALNQFVAEKFLYDVTPRGVG